MGLGSGFSKVAGRGSYGVALQTPVTTSKVTYTGAVAIDSLTKATDAVARVHLGERHIVPLCTHGVPIGLVSAVQGDYARAVMRRPGTGIK